MTVLLTNKNSINSDKMSISNFFYKSTYSFILLLGIFLSVSAQNGPKKINFRANRLEYDEAYLPGVDRFKGNVVFTHDQTTGYCDSAHFYKDRNYMEGFGERIRINLNDSLTLYGKYLTYDADLKIITISRNVILRDNNSALYTDSLVYHTNTEHGYYLTGGRMVSKDNILTSLIGNYYTNLNRIILEGNVKLVNNSYQMTCDSLAYNTETETTYFISRTKLTSEENIIYTNSGWYNTRKDVTLLVDSVELHNKTQFLTGDSIYYDKNLRFGIGHQNIVVIDSSKNYIIKGNYVEHYELGGTSVVTDSSLVILIENEDSLYLHADTLKIFFDSLQEPQHIQAYNKVKFYRSDMQGACDSLSYLTNDSILIMYYNPVIWSGMNQLSADTIRFYIEDSSNIRVYLIKSGFIVSSLYEETEFNQIKGLTITGYIQNQDLKRVDVNGNAECLYYIQEEDSSLVGINSSATSEMRIFLENNEVTSITFFNSPDGILHPENMLTPKERLLRDFRWLIQYRALSPKDIFHTPIPRYKVTPEEEN